MTESVGIRSMLSRMAQRGESGYWDWPDQTTTWNFDSGLPDPVTFPIDDLVRISERVLREDAHLALQYGTTTRGSVIYGYERLRELLAEHTARIDGRRIDLSELMLTSGGIQGIWNACQALLDPGDAMAVEAPTWGRAILAARSTGAEPIPIPLDHEGLRVDLLERELAQLRSEGRRLKLLYTIATFNTPAGVCLSLERRRRLVALAKEFRFFIVEDNCYGALRFAGTPLPTLFSLDDSGLVLKIDTFSKILAPAFRVGWVTGHADVVAALSAVRGDLGVSQWMSRVLAGFMEEGLLEPQIERVTELYGRKCETALRALEKHCGEHASWNRPEGGFFLWLELADEVDADEVARRTLAEGVVCRPGERFFGDGGDGRKYLRLAFAMVPEAELERGIAVLGKAITESVQRARVSDHLERPRV